jgi:hypothetical protein
MAKFAENLDHNIDSREGWHFDCCCDRCTDPEELGSMSGAVRCHSCRQTDVDVGDDDDDVIETSTEKLDKVRAFINLG